VNYVQYNPILPPVKRRKVQSANSRLNLEKRIKSGELKPVSGPGGDQTKHYLFEIVSESL